MLDSILLALGLVLIIEGLLPFASPGLWRASLARIARLPEHQIRLVALGAMIIGLLLILA